MGGTYGDKDATLERFARVGWMLQSVDGLISQSCFDTVVLGSTALILLDLRLWVLGYCLACVVDSLVGMAGHVLWVPVV